MNAVSSMCDVNIQIESCKIHHVSWCLSPVWHRWSITAENRDGLDPGSPKRKSTRSNLLEYVSGSIMHRRRALREFMQMRATILE